jgi:hypothetical protein
MNLEENRQLKVSNLKFKIQIERETNVKVDSIEIDVKMFNNQIISKRFLFVCKCFGRCFRKKCVV